ncbi:MAG TPA: ABC transporter substrate-binding protein, partial [Candidatus Binatia bacterium]|nr:ABC transporter substrate-binding protein [Candidatus Binatia bacterium]
MKRFVWQWLAISSMLVATLAARAETRPQYGGTLRVGLSAALSSLDPADAGQDDSFARRSVTRLIFDNLVTSDSSGRVQPFLAESWQATNGNRRWQFRIRRGVKFHDGTPATPQSVAASLRVANPSWNVTVEGELVVFEFETAKSELPAELAMTRNAIVKRDPNGRLNGTGPFRIVDWPPGKTLALAADDNCWRGRAFLDGIQIAFGRSYRDQMTALELGKADLVEVAPEQAHRVSPERYQVLHSPPMELVALEFTREASSADESALRQALNLSVERGSIYSVLLQGTGAPTASILPTWMSGYGFVFSVDANLPKARQMRQQARIAQNWKLGYESGDPLARLLADRIALNAKDAGLTLQPTPGTGDLRLIRVPLTSTDPRLALDAVLTRLNLPEPKTRASSVDDLYTEEQAALATARVIPLIDLPVTYGSTPKLRDWELRTDGSWDVSSAWLES